MEIMESMYGLEPITNRETPLFFMTNSRGKILNYTDSSLAECLGIQLYPEDKGSLFRKRHVSDYISRWPMLEEDKQVIKTAYEKIMAGDWRGFEYHFDTIGIKGKHDLPIHGHHLSQRADNGYVFTSIHDESPVTAGKREGDALLQGFRAVAHEFKDPLMVIGGFLRRMSKGINDPGIQQYIDRIASEFVDLEEVTVNLLNMAEGNVKPRKEDVELYKKIISPSLDRVSRMLTDRRITIDYESSLAEAIIFTDLVMTRIIYMNLFSNAARYAKSRISFGIEDCGDYSILDVFNDGPEIPKEVRGEIFRIGYRQKDDKTEGTGIGLATCKKMTDSLGERIWVRDADEGIDFAFTCKKPRDERLVYDLGLLNEPLILAPVGR